jgi:hypothetical protein
MSFLIIINYPRILLCRSWLWCNFSRIMSFLSWLWCYVLRMLLYLSEISCNISRIMLCVFLVVMLCRIAMVLWFDLSGRFGALTSDSTHHFFRNACTKSRSLRFSQFSGCWLILSVYIIMSFDFPFVRLFGVR